MKTQHGAGHAVARRFDAAGLTPVVAVGASAKLMAPELTGVPMPQVRANGIDIEYENFGREGDPLILLIMGFAA